MTDLLSIQIEIAWDEVAHDTRIQKTAHTYLGHGGITR